MVTVNKLIKAPVKRETPKARRRREYQERAYKAWDTRWANLRAAGRVDANGEPSLQERRKRRKIAKKAWQTRRELYGETGFAA